MTLPRPFKKWSLFLYTATLGLGQVTFFGSENSKLDVSRGWKKMLMQAREVPVHKHYSNHCTWYTGTSVWVSPTYPGRCHLEETWGSLANSLVTTSPRMRPSCTVQWIKKWWHIYTIHLTHADTHRDLKQPQVHYAKEKDQAKKHAHCRSHFYTFLETMKV